MSNILGTNELIPGFPMCGSVAVGGAVVLTANGIEGPSPPPQTAVNNDGAPPNGGAIRGLDAIAAAVPDFEKLATVVDVVTASGGGRPSGEGGGGNGEDPRWRAADVPPAVGPPIPPPPTDGGGKSGELVAKFGEGYGLPPLPLPPGDNNMCGGGGWWNGDVGVGTTITGEPPPLPCRDAEDGGGGMGDAAPHEKVAGADNGPDEWIKLPLPPLPPLAPPPLLPAVNDEEDTPPFGDAASIEMGELRLLELPPLPFSIMRPPLGATPPFLPEVLRLLTLILK